MIVGSFLAATSFVAVPSSEAQVTCIGDCDINFAVEVNELITMVGIALGANPIDACRLGDLDGGSDITVDEILSGVQAALEGCDPAQASLVAEFSDYAPWCNKQRQCETLPENCEAFWSSRGTVAAAVRQLSDAAIQSCLSAAQAESACALPLNCSQFANYAAFWSCPPGERVDCCQDGRGEPAACPATAPCVAQLDLLTDRCSALRSIVSLAADFSGEWSGSWRSNIEGRGSVFSDAHLEQVGSAVYGTINITGSQCLSAAVISARVDNSDIEGTVRGEDGYSLAFEGHISLDTIFGTYRDDNPGCGPDQGTFEIERAFRGTEGDSRCERCIREFTYNELGQQISGPEHCRRISCAHAACNCPGESSSTCFRISDAGFPSREIAEECDRCSGTLPPHAGECGGTSTGGP
jgi:hypothetical protein